MGMLSILKTAGSALTAQRLRMDVISSNIANAEATNTPEGGPYRRERVVFSPTEPRSFNSLLRSSFNRRTTGGAETGGVEVRSIVEDEEPGRMVYDPTHPDADEEGYVEFPNVDLVTEMTDMLSASRAHEANVTVLNSIKQMAQRSIDLGRA